MDAFLQKRLNRYLHIGTRSVLFGVHSIFTHPYYVWKAWNILENDGKPTWSLPLMVSCLVHDLGYWGKTDFDGKDEGETHPELGAKIMHFLFDGKCEADDFGNPFVCRKCGKQATGLSFWGRLSGQRRCFKWHDFVLYHSRYYAKRDNVHYSRLCVADKLAMVITPRDLYLNQAHRTGEIEYFYENAAKYEGTGFHSGTYNGNPLRWHAELSQFYFDWVEKHKDYSPDMVTEDRYHRHG